MTMVSPPSSMWRTVPDADLFDGMESGSGLDWSDTADRSTVRYITDRGLELRRPLLEADSLEIDGGKMVRKIPKYKGRKNYSGFAWMATGSRTVQYESLLELSRLMIADFDRTITAVNTQVLELTYTDEKGKVRSRFPDFFLLTTRGPLIVDVTSEHKLYAAARVAAFTWTAAAVRGAGWRYEVWCGADSTAMGNLTLLSGYRRQTVVDLDIVEEVSTYGQSAQMRTIVEALSARHHQMFVKPALRYALWEGIYTFDMTEFLQSTTWLTFQGGARGIG